jgi:2-polyprenyl-3-methyl-5-hydroxy-6-metoxy-1,4-benzoquinol methylase
VSRVYVLEGQVFDLVRCRNCGLVRVSPMLAPDRVRALYTEEYFEQDFACGVREGTYLETDATRVREYREILEMIKKYRSSGKFLEVGCAAGGFLNYAGRAGFEVEGVDISEWAAKTAREQLGLEVHTGRLVESGLPESGFDVVFLGDLLEHEPEPLEFLAEVKRVTKPEGLVAIKVPTYVNSRYYRTLRRLPISWALRRLDTKLLQALKLSDQGPHLPPYHLYEYSLDTLSRMCQKIGLKVIDHRSSLLVPEFLEGEHVSLLDRIAHLGFRLLRFLVRRLNLPAGHVMVLAVHRRP